MQIRKVASFPDAATGVVVVVVAEAADMWTEALFIAKPPMLVVERGQLIQR